MYLLLRFILLIFEHTIFHMAIVAYNLHVNPHMTTAFSQSNLVCPPLVPSTTHHYIFMMSPPNNTSSDGSSLALTRGLLTQVSLIRSRHVIL